MARMLGVRGKRLIALAFILSGALAGIMSLLFVTQKGVLTFGMGVPIMLFFFIATVIGGMGSLVGAVVGVASALAIAVAGARCSRPFGGGGDCGGDLFSSPAF